MSRVIPIRRFGGMITNPQGEDIPDNAAVWARDTDPNYKGKLIGIPVNGDAYTANGSAITDVYEADFIKYEDSGTEKWDLIYIDKNSDDIMAVEDFYNTEVNRTLTTVFNLGGGDTTLVTDRGSVECCKVFDNAAQIGVGNGTDERPYTVSRLLTGRAVFNSADTVPAGLYVTDGELLRGSSSNGDINITSATMNEENASSDYFDAVNNIKYKWGITLVYDGLQETNLITANGDGTSSGTPGNTSTTATIRITAKGMREVGGGAGDLTLLDPRITGIKIYRAESSDTNAANLGLYRLVESVSINDSGWTGSGNDFYVDYTDNGGYPEGGATYEEETGVSETLKWHYVHYSMNEVGGGYHWMARGYVPYSEIGAQSDADWDRYIFRSKKFRPNMVDWSKDFLVLPEIPTAIAWYENKLYAFSENKMHRINPELLIIEDTFEGVGCSNRQAVTVTEFGMFFCNKQGAYRFSNNQVDVISDAIKEDGDVNNVGWRSFAEDTFDNAQKLGRIITLYDTDMRSTLFIGNSFGSATFTSLAYHLTTGSWREWTCGVPALDTNSGAFIGKNGEIYFSGTTALSPLMRGVTTRAFDWASKEFHLGEPSQEKSWKKLKWDSSGTILVKYNTDGGNPVSGTSATNDAYINTYAKTFQIYIDGSASAEMDSIDILVRDLVGKR